MLFSYPNSFTGSTNDVKRISKLCREKGISLIVDFAHGVGAMDININSLDITAGVFCTYKYLCAGPGCVGAIYINDSTNLSPKSQLKGWFGYERSALLKQGPDFVPSTEGLKRYQISTFDPCQLARLIAALELFEEVGFENVWAAN